MRSICYTSVTGVVWDDLGVVFYIFAPDSAFVCDFLNAVNSLFCCSVSYMVACGLYFRLKNVCVYGNVGGVLLLF